jgi:hypothetical protein
MVPGLFFNLRRALLPLLADETYEAMRAVGQEVERRGKEFKERFSSKRLAPELTAPGDLTEGPGAGEKRARQDPDDGEEEAPPVMNGSGETCETCFELC